MADTKSNRTENRRETGQALDRPGRERQGIQRWDPSMSSFSPFEFFDRMTEEVDRTFGRLLRDFGRRKPSEQRAWPYICRGDVTRDVD